MKEIKCPLCEYNLEYRESNGTHSWVCDECPLVMFEYHFPSDIEELKTIIK